MGSARLQAVRRHTGLLLLAVCMFSTACSDDTGSSVERAAVTTTRPCTAPVTPAGAAGSGPAALPPGAIATSSVQDGPTTTLRGHIAMEPVAARDWYEAAPGLQVLEIEDEGFEMEARVTDGRYRTVVKIERVCPGISEFVAVVAAEL